MMRSVPGRVSSPTFIGRRDQLEALRSALAAIERDPRRIVLVHGEAGIGKTRLLDEFARSAVDEPPGDRPMRILRGTCVELGSGELPFAPVLDVLDDLANGTDDPDDRTAAWALRDELGGAGPSDRISSGRGRIFVAIRDLLVRAAAGADVVVCIDDLHWADRSTLDLVTFLSTRLSSGRVLIVLAYRSDEIHRRHPLRPVLAELARSAVVADIPLDPLGASEIRDQLGAILGATPGASRFERIVALADGNPFHAEELAALGVDARTLPRSLQEVLLARLDRLDGPTLELLGLAAVIGRDVDEGLLVAVSPRTDAEIRVALRQAVDEHVLAPASDGRSQRFRHALLREAVLSDLLPSERVALHRQVAEALETRPELAASSPATAAAELAYHWSEAGDTARALPALIEAGRRAQAANAWSEASEAFERAADLAATGAGSLAPIDQAELRMRSAWLAGFAGDLRRGSALAQVAVETDDRSDQLRSGVLLTWLATLASDGGDFLLAESASERAVELIPARPPSTQRADAVAHLAGRRMIANRCREAIELADEAIAISRVVGTRARLGSTLGCRAISAASIGRIDDARTALDEAVQIYASLGDDDAYSASEIVTNVAFALYLIGDFDRVLPFVDDAMAHARAIGAERGWARWVESTAALTAIAVGDRDTAEERLERYRDDAEVGLPLMDAVLIEGELASRIGDRARVEQLMTGGIDGESHAWFAAQFARVRAEAALWDGDVGSATQHVETALAIMAGQEELPSLTGLINTSVRTYADLAERDRATRDLTGAAAAARRAAELEREAQALAAGTHLDGGSSTPWMRAIATQVEAEAGRAAGRSDPAAWGRAAAAHAAVGTLPDLGYCRYRQGEALLAAADRAAATARLVEARRLAAQVTIVPLVDRIDDLARRARLSLDEDAAATEGRPSAPLADPWGLSQREREVLALVGEGRTNRQIGEALFISDKTASVHVTHILVKMGVSSRTEAALLAGRSGQLASEASRLAIDD